MENVILGESLNFKQTFHDSEGILTDPQSVSFRVYRVVNVPTFGPFYYEVDEGPIMRTAEGMYEVTILAHQSMMPGIYTAEWSGLIDSEAVYDRTEFQITEQPIERSTLLDPHRLYGTMGPGPRFNELGLGYTSQLCIVAHASGLSINEPFQVADVQEAINIIGANQYSPMVRYLLEAYNAGALDIWLVASAPEREYVQWDPANPNDRLIPREEFGNKNFYEQYESRYIETMQVLSEHDFPDIVVAPDAPLYNAGGVDFLTPLLDSCVEGFLNTGRFRFGFIGTLMGTDFTESDLDAIENDDRLNSFGEDGKTIGVFMGEGTINPGAGLNAYSHSCINVVAATAAVVPMESGITYKNLKGIVSPLGMSLPKERVRSLANAKVNSLIRTAKAKRGQPYNATVASDNLLAVDGSDFWALAQMKIVQEVVKVTRAFSMRRIGTIQYREYKRDVTDYLTSLIMENRIRDYEVFFQRKNEDPYKLTVEIVLKPYFGVREIFFSVEVGSGDTSGSPLRSAV